MATKICEICGKETDTRGYTQHVRKCKEEHRVDTEPKQEPKQEIPKEIIKEVPKPVKQAVAKIIETVNSDTGDNDGDDDDDDYDIEYESNTSGSWVYVVVIFPILLVMGVMAYLFGVRKNE